MKLPRLLTFFVPAMITIALLAGCHWTQGQNAPTNESVDRMMLPVDAEETADETELSTTAATPLLERTNEPAMTTPPEITPSSTSPGPTPEISLTSLPRETNTATPLATEETEVVPEPLVHVVKVGDTLFDLSQFYGVSVGEIQKVNRLLGNVILVGDELQIPQSRSVESVPEIIDVSPTPKNVIVTEPPLPTVTVASTDELVVADPLDEVNYDIFGYSVQGRPLEVYTFGDGPNRIVFVGSIHGGYEWNTTTLAYQAIDYFTQNPGAVPEAVTLQIVPTANPDGIFLVTEKTGRIYAGDLSSLEPLDAFEGRFNANRVDLNRNWDCQWSPQALWRDVPINPGFEPFSEVENVALLHFLTNSEPGLVVLWHSAAGIVAPGECEQTHLPSLDFAQVYGDAAGYTVQPFLAYDVTGDASDSLALRGIPSIAVELYDHTNTDWDQNLAGMLAVLSLYDSMDEVCPDGLCS